MEPARISEQAAKKISSFELCVPPSRLEESKRIASFGQLLEKAARTAL